MLVLFFNFFLVKQVGGFLRDVLFVHHLRRSPFNERDATDEETREVFREGHVLSFGVRTSCGFYGRFHW